MKYTYCNAFNDLQKARRDLNDAEEYYIYINERILKREHFSNGNFKRKVELSSLSKLELSIAFNKFQKAFIKYYSLSLLVDKLKEDKDK